VQTGESSGAEAPVAAPGGASHSSLFTFHSSLSTFPIPVVQFWVRVLALLVALLGARGIGQDPASSWGSGATFIAVSAMLGSLAIWLGRPREFFAAGLSVNVTLSLVLWDVYWFAAFETWWIVLVQANVVVCAIVAILWLAMSRRFQGAGKLLSVQVLLGLIGNAVLLVRPAVEMSLTPGQAPPGTEQIRQVTGWLALAGAILASAWYLRLCRSRLTVHVLGGLELALGVLVACTFGGGDAAAWLAYHTLMLSWVAMGAVALVVGWRLAPRGQFDSSLSTPALRGWVIAFGALVIGLS